MSSKTTTIAIPIALLLCSLASAGEAPHWTYEGKEGPANWSKLAPEFGNCNGKHQSPINLSGFVEAELRPIVFSYSAAGTEIINNGHTEQIDFAPGSSISVDGVSFELKQAHFHAPSENHIDGKPFPMEAHLVHADAQGNLAVVAVLFEEGTANAALASAWSALPDEGGEKASLAEPLPASKLLPDDRDYYRFDGSLTTPPCTEGVRWLVMKKPVPASREQVESFLHAVHHPNNRPVQPLNARLVLQ